MTNTEGKHCLGLLISICSGDGWMGHPRVRPPDPKCSHMCWQSPCESCSSICSGAPASFPVPFQQSPRLGSLIANPKQVLCDGLAPCPETASEILLDVPNPQQAGGREESLGRCGRGATHSPNFPASLFQQGSTRSSLPFDLCLSRRAFHHILVDLSTGKQQQEGCQMQQWCHDLPVLHKTPLFLGPVDVQQPQAPCSPFSTSSADIMAEATQILTVSDCNLKYQPKATLG